MTGGAAAAAAAACSSDSTGSPARSESEPASSSDAELFFVGTGRARSTGSWPSCGGDGFVFRGTVALTSWESGSVGREIGVP